MEHVEMDGDHEQIEETHLMVDNLANEKNFAVADKEMALFEEEASDAKNLLEMHKMVEALLKDADVGSCYVQQTEVALANEQNAFPATEALSDAETLRNIQQMVDDLLKDDIGINPLLHEEDASAEKKNAADAVEDPTDAENENGADVEVQPLPHEENAPEDVVRTPYSEVVRRTKFVPSAATLALPKWPYLPPTRRPPIPPKAERQCDFAYLHSEVKLSQVPRDLNIKRGGLYRRGCNCLSNII